MGGQGKQVMGMREDTCGDELQVMYGTVESLYRTPETSITLYGNEVIFFFKSITKGNSIYTSLVINFFYFSIRCRELFIT